MDLSPEKWTVVKLKDFLRHRGKLCTGLKAELVQKVKDILQSPQIFVQPTTFQGQEVFEDNNHEWKNLLMDRNTAFPKSFDMQEISRFLVDVSATIRYQNNDDEEEEEAVEFGTVKPITKGRRMYLSEKVGLAELCAIESNLYIRGNIDASMKKNVIRYVKVVINKSGTVSFASCSCPLKQDGKCCHVACLLYFLEELALGGEPKYHKACTSKPQSWGKGSTSDNHPGPVYEAKYSKKRKPDSLIQFDPRPDRLRKTTREEVENFLYNVQGLHYDTMWSKLLSFHYDDYSLAPERIAVLKDLVKLCEDNFRDALTSIETDNLSNSQSVHLPNTLFQADSDEWHAARSLRITASTFKNFLSPTCVHTLWEDVDISNLVSVKWGRDHEEDARSAYEEITNSKVTRCGFFVSKAYPMLGASPDGILDGGKGVLELKCPFVLKNIHPMELHKLTTAQRNAFPCVIENGHLKLKRKHKYFMQVQIQMYTTGSQFCHFCL